MPWRSALVLSLVLLAGCNKEPAGIWVADDHLEHARARLVLVRTADTLAGRWYIERPTGRDSGSVSGATYDGAVRARLALVDAEGYAALVTANVLRGIYTPADAYTAALTGKVRGDRLTASLDGGEPLLFDRVGSAREARTSYDAYLASIAAKSGVHTPR